VSRLDPNYKAVTVQVTEVLLWRGSL
jgi:hypothetical protein